jgi:hypothetical protein
MRRAGSARPEAIMAEPTRSRASETALSGNPTTVNAGPRRYLHLHVDRPDLDALERYRGDALDHVRPTRLTKPSQVPAKFN